MSRQFDDRRRQRSRSRERSDREYDRDRNRNVGFKQTYENRNDYQQQRGNGDRDNHRGSSTIVSGSGANSDGYQRGSQSLSMTDNYNGNQHGERGGNPGICYAFQRGECERGNNCRFSHNETINNQIHTETKTVMIKGLPSKTNEAGLYQSLAAYSPQEIRLIAQRETGDCKGFAFVEFYSVEHAKYFMSCFAGSCGDPNAPQLIIDNRAVVLDYAKDRDRGSSVVGGIPSDVCFGFLRGDCERGSNCRFSHNSNSGISAGVSASSASNVKADWICNKCQCQNFARRNECFKCSSPKTDECTIVTSSTTLSNPDQLTDALVSNPTPTTHLVVRGVNPLVTEDQLSELFRQYAAVKSVVIIRDKFTGLSRGLAFIELHSVEHATYVLQSYETACSQSPSIPALKVSYARPSFMNQQLLLMEEPVAHQSMFAATSNPAFSAAMGMAVAAVLPPGYPPLPSSSMVWGGAMPVTSGSMYPVPVPLPSTSLPVPHSLPVNMPPPPQPLASNIPKDPITAMTKFPPNFDLYGAAYVFQSSSGLFLEQTSEFYYCPKSKLYYNSKNGFYYKYDINQSSETGSPFVRFIPPIPSILVDNTSNVQTSSTANTQNENGSSTAGVTKQPVKITIGFGKMKSSTSAATTSVDKKVLNNFMKWDSAREDLNTADDNQNITTSDSNNTNILVAEESAFAKPKRSNSITLNTAVATLSSTGVGVNVVENSNSNVVSSIANSTHTTAVNISNSNTTAVISNPPTVGSSNVCLICRRQFASPEQLSRHEKESKLHADNVAKLAATGGTVSANLTVGNPTPVVAATTSTSATATTATAAVSGSSTTLTYRDRASERRATYGTLPAETFCTTDWICSKCSCLNWKRETCYKCFTPRVDEYAAISNIISGNVVERPPSPIPASSKDRSSFSSSSQNINALKEDTANPGNQLLRKMGWSEGKGLGRSESGIEDPLEAKGIIGNSKAGIGNAMTNNADASWVYAGEGKEYRESIMRAAKARYDQIDQKEKNRK